MIGVIPFWSYVLWLENHRGSSNCYPPNCGHSFSQIGIVKKVSFFEGLPNSFVKSEPLAS
jgi:hypothetical protein